MNAAVFSTSEVYGAEKSTGSPLKAGEKHWIGGEYYFVYNFDNKASNRHDHHKDQVSQKTVNRTVRWKSLGVSDMPLSMRGAHSTEDKPFKLNKKGDYLLP